MANVRFVRRLKAGLRLARACASARRALALLMLALPAALRAEEGGALRVTVFDQDWDVPLPGAQVLVAEADKKRTTGEDGSVLFETLPGGAYTLVVTAAGFERQVAGPVVIVAGEVKSETVRLNGAFTDMDEFVVKDVDFAGGGT